MKIKKNKNRSQKDSPTCVPLSKIGRANIRYQVNIFWFTRGFVNLAKPTMCSLGNFLCFELNLVPGFKANPVKQKHGNEKYKIN